MQKRRLTDLGDRRSRFRTPLRSATFSCSRVSSTTSYDTRCTSSYRSTSQSSSILSKQAVLAAHLPTYPLPKQNRCVIVAARRHLTNQSCATTPTTMLTKPLNMHMPMTKSFQAISINNRAIGTQRQVLGLEWEDVYRRGLPLSCRR